MIYSAFKTTKKQNNITEIRQSIFIFIITIVLQVIYTNEYSY